MDLRAAKVGGIVLCGGQSRRMGAPKAWLPCGGEHLLQRLVRVVSAVVQPVVVAGRSDQPLPPLPDDVSVVHDKIDDSGPLAGIAAGFDALADICEAAFVVSCDLPLLRPSFIERLVELLGEHSAVVPRTEGGLHPLAAVYRLDTRTTLAELLARGELRAHQFVRACNAHVVGAADLAAVDPQLDSLVNVNNPEAYERIIRSLVE